ncbi:MAG: molybdenum cofactor biosynthesis protein MoaE [Gammaproteobacteria bacterium]
MHIDIVEQAFAPYTRLQEYQDQLPAAARQFGATAVFVGSMRDFNQGDAVQQMHLEHYPGMSEKELQRIGAEAAQQWQLLDALIVHRVGDLHPVDPIVLVAVWSVHRRDAFEACRYIMEALKSRAPFWKKETLSKGERWVDNNTAGY